MQAQRSNDTVENYCHYSLIVNKKSTVEVVTRPGHRFAADPPDKLGHLRGQAGQAELVDRILGQKTGGFFIECGAAEGEDYSNTLFFELKRNWTG